jgi:redox-sensitive bicupin YhaK (pirin superfamily)
MVRGALHVNGTALQAGDGLALEHETTLQLVAQSDNTEFLIFDLP